MSGFPVLFKADLIFKDFSTFQACASPVTQRKSFDSWQTVKTNKQTTKLVGEDYILPHTSYVGI